MAASLSLDPHTGDVARVDGRSVYVFVTQGYRVLMKRVGAPVRDKHGASRRRKTTFKVHRLMWIAHRGPIPPGMQINHINGNKLDNRLENLEVVTPSENSLHSYRTGLQNKKGERNGRATITAKVAALIGKEPRTRTSVEVAARYGTTAGVVRSIRAGRTWQEQP